MGVSFYVNNLLTILPSIYVCSFFWVYSLAYRFWEIVSEITNKFSAFTLRDFQMSPAISNQVAYVPKLITFTDISITVIFGIYSEGKVDISSLPGIF